MIASEEYTSIIEESAIVKGFDEDDDKDGGCDGREGEFSEEQINTESHIKDGSQCADDAT